MVIGKRPAETANDQQDEPLAIDMPELETPAERPSTAAPLFVSLFVVLGLFLVMSLVVAVKARDTQRVNEPMASKLKAANVRPKMASEDEEADKPSAVPARRNENPPERSKLNPFDEPVASLPPFEPPDEGPHEPFDLAPKIAENKVVPPAKLPPAAPPVSTISPPDSTISNFDKAIAKNPKDAVAYYGRAMAYLAKENYDQAIKDFNQAIQLHPLLSDAYAKREIAYKKKLKASPIPGYKVQKIEGFTVLIADSVFTHNDDPGFQRKPLEALKSELFTVANVLPRRAVTALRTILIWVEWYDDYDPDINGGVVAKYYGASGNRFLWGLREHKHPLKANNVEIINMRALTAMHQSTEKVEQCVILHELAHAVHFQLFGSHNMTIKWAYEQATQRNLYDTSRDINGNTVKPYARTNEYEYFAELSCAYFNKLNYFPFTREELRKYDPTGYQMMEATWGKPNRRS
jgi:tetratricopeptide (TPR) repeat protein